MGILIEKELDDIVYKEAYDEAQRIIRISEEVRISLDEVRAESKEIAEDDYNNTKLTSSKLAAKHKLKTNELLDKFVTKGYLILNNKDKNQLTEQGKSIGGEFKFNSYRGYFLWPDDLEV